MNKETQEFPPPPAYYKMFALPETSEGLEPEAVSFPLPPPALPLAGQPVMAFGFRIPFTEPVRHVMMVNGEGRTHRAHLLTVARRQSVSLDTFSLPPTGRYTSCMFSLLSVSAVSATPPPDRALFLCGPHHPGPV
jgi:hypothetical protein